MPPRERDRPFDSSSEETEKELNRDTSLIGPSGPYMYRRPMPRAVWWSLGGGCSLMSGVPV